MRYISTRGMAPKISAGQAILKGLADDGGLYVPESIPIFDKPLEELFSLSYPSLAYEILKPYLTDFTEDELRQSVEQAYTYPGHFDHAFVAPLVKKDGLYFLELFHGRTLAFKDMALSLLPRLLTLAAQRYRPGIHTVVLTATSGDTGKAALEGFAGVEGVSVAVFYPEDGVSAMQKLQMVTQEGKNTYVIGVQGNFDDTQTGVKRIFGDKALAGELERCGRAFSSANSINIGRLLPQIVYYVYAYGQLVKSGAIHTGEPVDFTVPTGNFGNILAGYYAMRMGLPIGKLVCASNQNNVLYEFIRTGIYDLNRAFYTTISPSMDILVSSNLERLLYHLSNDSEQVRALMYGLSEEGRYRFDIPLSSFYAAYATEEETKAALRETAKRGYITDPHTATAFHAQQAYEKESNKEAPNQGRPNIIIATASPYKFAADVLSSLEEENATSEVFALMETLNRVSGVPIPEPLLSLREKKIRHTTVCSVEEMKQTLTKTVIFPKAR